MTSSDFENQSLVDRRRVLRGLGVAAGAAAVGSAGLFVADAQGSTERRAAPAAAGKASADAGLKRHARARGLLYSAASNLPEAKADRPLADALRREAAGTTAGGNFLLKNLRGPAPDFRYDFKVAERFVRLAEKRELRLLNMGHLVWHGLLPRDYVAALSDTNARSRMVDHVRTVAGQYSGRVHSWNVVNEVVWPEHGRADGLRETPWLAHIGPSYIDTAFTEAREADPDALLVINDFGLEWSSPDDVAKRAAMLKLLKGLVDRGVPVDALGLQAHLTARYHADPSPSQKRQYRDFLKKVEDLGLKIMITELDVWHSEPDDALVARVFGGYLDLALENPAVISVQTWGLSDKYNWQGRFLPLDADMRRKKTWRAIAEAFDRAPVRDYAFD